MASITTRAGKGTPLTANEVDANFTNLNNNKAEITGATGAVNVPVGTAAQRPTPVTGQLRFNSESGSFEGYNGAQWNNIGTDGVSVISSNTTAQPYYVYVLTASLTLTLPASPQVGNYITVSNLSNTTTCVIARNGTNIMGLAEDLTIDTVNSGFKLIYSGASKGWVVV